ncbi:MAG TPA: hypothetical protein PLL10_02755, partial [Elusimicrobiales bacterium]|nr:hypothetical protein [Elusimicrobiales bacterium]
MKNFKDSAVAAAEVGKTAADIPNASDVMAAASFIRAEALLKEGAADHACAELIHAGERLLPSADSSARSAGAMAWLDCAKMLFEKRQLEKALSLCLKLWESAKEDSSSEIRCHAHDGARLAGELLASLGRGAQALEIFEDSLARIAVEKGHEFTDTRMPEAILSRARALLVLG